MRLLVHGFAATLAQAATDTGRLPSLPSLERLLQRGRYAPFGETRSGWWDWHLTLLALLGIAADQAHAAAPLEWLGHGGESRTGSWLRLDFVHLAVGAHRSHVERIPLLNSEEAEALMMALTEPLWASGFEVLPPAGRKESGHWYLHTAWPLDAVCPLPEEAAVMDVRSALPQGRDGPQLRRLLTEAQMLLHEHPVNAQRELVGLKAANAIWLSGLGVHAPVQVRKLGRLFSDEPYVMGLSRAHAAVCEALPRNGQDLLDKDEALTVVAVEPDDDAASALQAFDARWLEPLLCGIPARRPANIDIVLDRWRIQANRFDLQRFWRRRVSLARLVSQASAGARA